MENSSSILEKEKVGKLLIKFSLPCVLSLLISSLYNIVDQIFVGNSSLGYLGNAATGIVFPIMIVVQAFAWLIADGCAAYLSICQGKKDTEKAHKSIGTGITIAMIISVILLIIALTLKEPILRLFGASDNTIGLASNYLTIVGSFFPAFMFFNVLNAVIRSDGSPTFSMLSMASGAIVNIILDPIFIFGCDMGIEGAAWATVIGQIISVVFTIYYLFRTKTFKLQLKSFIPDFSVFKEALKLGVSSFITQMSIVAISLVCNIMMAKYGASSKYGQDIPISVISVETKVFTVLINIVVGIVLGGQPIVGYNIGAKRFDRVKSTYKLVTISTLVVALIFTLINEIYPDLFILPFGNGGDNSILYMEFARDVFRIFLSLVTFTCLIKVSSIFFQASGKPILATISSLTRDIIIFIPCVIIIPMIFESFSAGSGITGLLYAAPIADMVGIIVVVGLTIVLFKSFKRIRIDDEDERTIENDDYKINASVEGPIIVINREHGSQGKAIGEMLAKKLNIPFYSKELIGATANKMGLDAKYLASSDLSFNYINNLYLSKTIKPDTINALYEIINNIADNGSCVIVGRAANYFLRERKNVISIFLYNDEKNKIKNIRDMYGDSEKEAIKNMKKSDNERREFYQLITAKSWENKDEYDICINTKIGKDKTVEIISQVINCRFKSKDSSLN